MANNLIPKYVHLSFNSKEAFGKWLKETTKYEIELEDSGQDLIKFWIADNMEIIHTETFNLASIYNGSFVTNGEPEELGMLQIFNTRFNDMAYLKYPIEKVIIHDNNS